MAFIITCAKLYNNKQYVTGDDKNMIKTEINREQYVTILKDNKIILEIEKAEKYNNYSVCMLENGQIIIQTEFEGEEEGMTIPLKNFETQICEQYNEDDIIKAYIIEKDERSKIIQYINEIVQTNP